MNTSLLCNKLGELKSVLLSMVNAEGERIAWKTLHRDKLANANEYINNYYPDLAQEINNMIKEFNNNCRNLFFERIKVIEYIETHHTIEMIEREISILMPYSYRSFTVDMQGYKCKCLYLDKDENEFIMKYAIMSFHSKEESKAFMAKLSKGTRDNRIEGLKNNVLSEKNGYIADEARCPHPNRGDGYHLMVRSIDSNVLRIHRNIDEVDYVYQWIKNNSMVGFLDIPSNTDDYENLLNELNISKDDYEKCVNKWKIYFYNKLNDSGIIRKCIGFDYTGKAPTIMIVTKEFSNDILRMYKQEGLQNGFIQLPVKNNIKLDLGMEYIDLVQNFIIDTIKNEKAHFNVGDKINDIIKSKIITESGKETKLYPKQQFIAQGCSNAVEEGKNSIIINGGTGIGKTYISIKLFQNILERFSKVKNGRVILYCQGHLLPKWQRQISECLNPLGVYPEYIDINSFKDVLKLTQKNDKLQVLLMPKDRVKRSYQLKHTESKKYHVPTQMVTLLETIEKSEGCEFDSSNVKPIIANVKDLPISAMKYACKYLERKYKRPILLYKENKNIDRENIYKIVTSSDKLISAYSSDKTKAYNFISEDLNKTINDLVLIEKEYKYNGSFTRRHKMQGLVCPDCGEYIYDVLNEQLDSELYVNVLNSIPKNRGKNRGHGYIKADGTSLTYDEKKKIREGTVTPIIVEKRQKSSAYLDDDGNQIVGKELIDLKAGKKKAYSIKLIKCMESGWTCYEAKGYRTVNAAETLLKKFGRKSCDILIADECHIYNKESNQGMTFATLCKVCKVKIAMTGTLTGGKASDLFYMLWRLIPQRMKKLGYTYEDVNLFIEHYGRRKKVTKEYLNKAIFNKTGKGKKSSSGWQEIPGISPDIYTNFLSGIMVSRKIEDMGIPMPKLRYFKHEIQMDEELQKGYDNLKSSLIDYIKKNQNKNLGGTYLHSLLSYPDMPVQDPIYCFDELVAVPEEINIKDRLLPKEEQLLKTIRKEINEGRRIFVYVTYTGSKGVSKRVYDVIKDAGFNVAELTSNVELTSREKWIEDRYNEGVKVIISNPKLVETGLDIIKYPTMYFYEEDYDVKLIRQAEKRAYRPNQTEECRIYYSYYKYTLQSDAIKVIGAKKKASLAIEGVFSNDMLSSMGDAGESGAEMLYKALLGKITLAEDNLEAFGFEEEQEVSPLSTLVSNEKNKSEEKKIVENSFFVITEEHKKILKGKKKQVVGQLSLFDIA